MGLWGWLFPRSLASILQSFTKVQQDLVQFQEQSAERTNTLNDRIATLQDERATVTRDAQRAAAIQANLDKLLAM